MHTETAVWTVALAVRKVVGWFTVALVALAIVLSVETQTAPSWGHSVPSTGLSSVPSGAALELEQRLEARGYTCTEAAHPTDTIIADTQSGARVVTFDQAWRLSHEHGAWLRAYCVKSAT